MDPFSPTHTEELIKVIKDNAVDKTDIIKEYIEKHNPSEMLKGVRYYNNESDIKKRKKYYYRDGQKVEDTQGLKTNNKIPHNWHKILVDQKSSYLVGQPIVFEAEEEAFTEILNEKFDDEFDDIANELVKGASNKGKEWLHVYINGKGEFDYIIIPAEEVIPIYDNTKRKNLLAVIRVYPLDDDTLKVEFWDDQRVTYYEEVNGELVLDMSYEVNPAPHFEYGTDEETKGYGWGEVPFIKFANNTEEVSDLTFYKELIDEYDRKVSDASNNLEEIQELIYILKGYEGENLSEFMQNLLFYKAVNVDEEGGVDTVQGEVPMDSLNSHLDRTEEAIWTFGQGVRVNTDKFGNNPTGVALKFLYTLLDLKSNHIERKFRKGLKRMVWFFAEFLSMSKQGEYDPKKVRYTFNRTMITNETEKIDNIQKSKGIVSDETLIANHPMVDDAQEEMKRLESQQKEMARYLPPIDSQV
jgi:SPP1 family phage portal protein